MPAREPAPSRLCAFLVLALGCAASTSDTGVSTAAGSASTSATSSTPGSTSTTAGTSTTGGTTTSSSTAITGTAAVSGAVIDTDGAPVEGMLITFCGPICRNGYTATDGSFSFTELPAAGWALHVNDITKKHGWAQQLTIVTLEDTALELERPFVMVEQGSNRRISGGVVEIVDGLRLELDPAALELPFGAEEGIFAGTATDHYPPSLPGEALAVWFLSPMDAVSEIPIPVEIDNDWGLAPGEELQLYEASLLEAAWLDAGMVTVSDDGSVLAGGALTTLSTMVLVR